MERADKYGHCVVCHKNMIIERVVDGKVITMFTPDHSHTEFMLNDGSRMRVAICLPCKQSKDLGNKKIQEEVMQSVVEGWQLEVDALVKGITKKDGTKTLWRKDKADAHMQEYRKKGIICNCENMPDHAIEKNKKRVVAMLEANKHLLDEVKIGPRH